MARYFMPGPDDGFLKNILTWIKTGKRFRPRFPRILLFQTLSTCNGKCIFCCHYHHPEAIPHGRMDDALISKIIAECGQRVMTRISPYLTNEPLMDKRMPDILGAIKKAAHWPVKTMITTNASLLTEEMGERLLNSRLSHLHISVNGYSPETYRASMGLDFEKTMQNIDNFLYLKKKRGMSRPKVKITTTCTNIVEGELEDAKKYWAKRDVNFGIFNLDNRTGEKETCELRTANAPLSRKRDCDEFLTKACIVENGDMILCCHDWRQSVVVGNVAKTSIAEVWDSKRFKTLIYEYYAENFENLEICRNCI